MRIFVAVPGVGGEARVSGYEGQIECQALRHTVDADPQNPTSTGKVYHPVELTKAWDAASPALANALIAKTVFPTVTIACVAETPTFGARHVELRLIDARIASVAQSGSQGGAALPTEKVTIDLAAIEVTYAPPGTAPRTVADSPGQPASDRRGGTPAAASDPAATGARGVLRPARGTLDKWRIRCLLVGEGGLELRFEAIRRMLVRPPNGL